MKAALLAVALLPLPALARGSYGATQSLGSLIATAVVVIGVFLFINRR